MPGAPSASGRPPLRIAAGVAALVLSSTLALAACGGDDEPSGDEQAAAQPSADTAAGAPTETTAQPPPEQAGGATAGKTSKRSQETLVEEAPTGPQPCPDVVVTPNSGDGLFDVEAEGITCDDANAALQAWGASGYQGAGPPGFSCEEVAVNDNGSSRLSCEQQASGGVVEFETSG